MKYSVWILGCVWLLGGCSVGEEKIRSYWEQPEHLVEDPHFESYRNELDNLERAYLDKKISYAEYLEKKKIVDEKYAEEIQKRQNVIEGQE